MAWEPDCFYNRVMAARAKIPASVPFLLTEYSVMVGTGMAGRATMRDMYAQDTSTSTSAGTRAEPVPEAQGRAGEPPFQHDDAGAAAFVLRVVPQLAPHLDALSYWTFSDIFEENSIPRTEFHPVNESYSQPHYGAMTLHGIPKPVWRAFQLLHAHAGSHTVNTTAITSSSSPKQCTPEAGLLFSGGDLLPTPAPVASVEQCCNMCASTAGCQFFTFDTENQSEATGAPATHHCYLKSQPTGQSQGQSRWVSGSMPSVLPTLVSAVTTVNTTTTAARGGSARVFLSHWDASGAAANHSAVTVTVTLHCPTPGAAPNGPSGICPRPGAGGGSQLHMIDGSISANERWAAMGSPAVPSSAQLAELKTYSEVKPQPLVWKAQARGTMTAEVVMQPNSGCVISL